MNQLTYLLLFLCTLLLTVEGKLRWKNCHAGLPFNVTEVVVEPYPVEPGKEVSITSIGRQTEVVTGGNWSAYIAYGRLHLQELEGEVCGLAPKCPCPCSDKQVTTVLKTMVNRFAFTGEYNGRFTSVDQSGKPLSCVQFYLDIKSPEDDEPQPIEEGELL